MKKTLKEYAFELKELGYLAPEEEKPGQVWFDNLNHKYFICITSSFEYLVSVNDSKPTWCNWSGTGNYAYLPSVEELLEYVLTTVNKSDEEDCNIDGVKLEYYDHKRDHGIEIILNNHSSLHQAFLEFVVQILKYKSCIVEVKTSDVNEIWRKEILKKVETCMDGLKTIVEQLNSL